MDSEVVDLTTSLIFPDNKPPLRYNDGVAAQSTAAQTLTQDINLNWGTAVTDRAIPASNMQVFLFRDPLRSLIYYDHNVSRQTFRYLIRSTADGQEFYPVSGPNTGFWVPGGRATADGTYQPHGPVLYPVNCGGVPGYWCDYDGEHRSHLEIDLDDATTVAGGVINWFFWTGQQWSLWQSRAMFNGAQVYGMTINPPPGGAYMAVSISFPDGTSATQIEGYRLVCDGTGPAVWCHRACPGIDDTLPVVQNYRCVAAAMKWLNESATLDESGRVIAATVPPGIPWSNIAGGFDSLNVINGYRVAQAKKGYYGFTRPTEHGLEWSDNIVRSAVKGSTATNQWSDFMPADPYLTVCMAVSKADARDTSVTVTHMIEFMSVNRGQEIRLPEFSEQAWTHAIARLARAINHYHAEVQPEDILLLPDSVKRARR
jgi:hypothetical protein